MGDTASMTDPLLGEGIYYVLSLLTNPSKPLGAYRKVLKPLIEELIYAGKMAKLAYTFQKVAYKVYKEYVLQRPILERVDKLFEKLRMFKISPNQERQGL